MDEIESEPMDRQLSGLNTFWIVRYLESQHSEIDIDFLINETMKTKRYFVENLKTGTIEIVTKNHLANTDYWFSNEFLIALYSEILKAVQDPEIGYKMGRTAYKAQSFIKIALGVPLLGPKGILKRITKENKKYNRTKYHEILKLKKGHVILRVIHNEGITIDKFAMDWHRGIYESYALLSGATNVNVSMSPVDIKRIWDFDIKYDEPTIFERFLKIFLFNIPIVKKTFENAEEIQNQHREQIIDRERIIEERTKELRETQAKLVESEKRTLEHRITGGFAHEMRNALAGAQLEFKTTLNYQDKGRTSADLLKDSATTLLKNISQIHSKHNISKEEIAKLFLPELKTIADIADHLSETISGVSRDLDRGLSITSQIRNYAKLSAFKAGDTPVNIVPLLKDYAHQYRREFEEHGIKYSVSGIEKSIIMADKIHINSIFSNLVLNALDAMVESDTTDPEIKISLESDANQVVVKIIDNGPGIKEEHLQEIFEPFFSTKPTSGIGLGLGIVKKLVQLYGGEIEVNSEPNVGAEFSIKLSVN